MGSILLAVANQRQERLALYNGYINTAILEKELRGEGDSPYRFPAVRFTLVQSAMIILSRLEGAYQSTARRVTAGGLGLPALIAS